MAKHFEASLFLNLAYLLLVKACTFLGLKYSAQLPCMPEIQSTAALFLKAPWALLKSSFFWTWFWGFAVLAVSLGVDILAEVSLCVLIELVASGAETMFKAYFSQSLQAPVLTVLTFYFWIMEMKKLPPGSLGKWKAMRWLHCLGLHFLTPPSPGLGLLPTHCCLSSLEGCCHSNIPFGLHVPVGSKKILNG